MSSLVFNDMKLFVFLCVMLMMLISIDSNLGRCCRIQQTSLSILFLFVLFLLVVGNTYLLLSRGE